MRLQLKDRQLVCCPIAEPDNIKSFPIEDIGYVVLEHQQTHISLPLLNALAENNTSVIFCNDKMMPSAMLLNLDSNNTQGEKYRYQIAASEPLKKNLWKQIITAKVKNQAALLKKIRADGDILKPLYMNVKSGDVDNREGVAARLYWKMLFGNSFSRNRDGEAQNILLNYGYSILRAAVARALMGSGLFPAFGIFHRNRYNAFPLADDMMEPYRPYVDNCVYDLHNSGCGGLTKDVKAELLKILFSDTRFGDILRPLDVGLTMSTASLADCFSGEKKILSFPVLE